MGFASVLCLIFLALKIFEIVGWPWIYVFSPYIVNILLYAFAIFNVAYRISIEK